MFWADKEQEGKGNRFQVHEVEGATIHIKKKRRIKK